MGKVTKIKIEPSSLELQGGQRTTIKAVLTPSTNTGVGSLC